MFYCTHYFRLSREELHIGTRRRYKHRNLLVYRTLLQRQRIQDGKKILNNKQAFKDLGEGTDDVFVEESGENSENLGEVNRYTTEIGQIYRYICLSSSLLGSETILTLPQQFGETVSHLSRIRIHYMLAHKSTNDYEQGL